VEDKPVKIMQNDNHPKDKVGVAVTDIGALSVEVLGREVMYQGFFAIEKIQLRHRLFNGSWSSPLTRELFVRGNAVAAVIYDPIHRLIGLVEQFRIGLVDDSEHPWCKEVVAGMAEKGEAAEQVIRRELQEEAGVTPTALCTICDYYSSPGGTNEKLTLYCAIADLSEAGGIYGLSEEDEDIHFAVYHEEAVLTNLYGGDYGNAATLICLQWLAANKQHLTMSGYSVSDYQVSD
jgi:ADP-ribose pyrophosphatase